MKKIKYFLWSLLLTVVACQDPFLDTTYLDNTNMEEEMTCAAVLKKNAEEFSLWIELLKYADYYNALNDATVTATVFAPTNAAMEAFLAWQGVSSVRELNLDYAKAVAQVHILNYDLSDESLVNYAEKSATVPYTTIFGSYLSAAYGYTITDVDDIERTSMVYVTDSIYLNNQARLEKFTAIKTGNGEIFTMGDVIHPLAETILDKLRPYNEYKLFIEAAERCGYDSVTTLLADTLYNLDGTISINKYNFTCFAVPDEVYKKESVSSVEDLIAYLKDHKLPGDATTDDEVLLRNYISYHFLPRSYTAKQLFFFVEKGQVLIMDTHLHSQVIMTENDSVTGEDLINGTTHIIRSDMTARNGLIHKIDNIMTIFSPKPVTIMWDFCNSSDIVSIVNSYGSKKNLGEIFSTPIDAKEQFVDLSKDKRDGDFGTITSFTYQANSARSNYAVWRKVGYMKCCWANKKEPTINKYGAYLDNLMTLNLGYAGWIEMQTPTIIKGRYRVEIGYASAAPLRPFYSTGSLTKINMDDYQNSFYMWKGLPNDFGSGVTTFTLWNEIEFGVSKCHTFKITMMDIKAKNDTKYRQMWDYVKFIPLD